MSLADGTSEGHDVDASRPSCAKRRRSGRGSRSGGVDVVHDNDLSRHPRQRSERAAHVQATLPDGQACLPSHGASSLEQRRRLDVPPRSQLPREPVWWVVPATDAPVLVGRDIGDDVCRRPLDGLDDEIGAEDGESAEAALLPRPDHVACAPGVRHARASRCERDPPARALHAAIDGPLRRCAAPRAERRNDPDERGATGLAEPRSIGAAGDAPRRKDEIEKPPGPRYGRDRDVSVSAL